MKLVLTRPGLSNKAEKKWSFALPLGIAYLASYAEKEGIEVSIIDGKIEQHFTCEETVDEILRESPDFVGISIMTVDYPKAQRISSLLIE